jgi:hypothetical protein
MDKLKVMQRTLGLLGSTTSAVSNEDVSTIVNKSKTGEEQLWEQVIRVVFFILMFQWVGKKKQDIQSSSSVREESAARNEEPSVSVEAPP